MHTLLQTYLTKVVDTKKFTPIEEEELLNKSKSLLHSLDASAHKISATEIDVIERFNSRGSERPITTKTQKSSVDQTTV